MCGRTSGWRASAVWWLEHEGSCRCVVRAKCNASVNAPDNTGGKGGRAATPKLKSLPDEGKVVVETATQLTGIPADAWRYRLGNRSATDWVLDEHKEKKIKDPTVAAKFNTYRFVDHKESMIALLAKVVRVSIDTVAITTAMRAVKRDG